MKPPLRDVLLASLAFLLVWPAQPSEPRPSVPEGDYYEGSFVNGRKHATSPVLYRWKDGSEYHGCFVNDVMTGEGTFRSSSGALYTGAFLDNQFHGQGRLEEGNGDSYEVCFHAALHPSS